MQAIKLLSYSLIILNILTQTLSSDSQSKKHKPTKPKPTHHKQIAEWSFLTYIAADNSLADYAAYNISDMAKGVASLTSNNILVQWDQPRNNKTWRYKITSGGKIDIGTISMEMGYNPAKELGDAVQWMVNKYPAKHYAIVLWNHGSGIEDFEPGIAKLGMRGILYDDSQNTCLTNQGLSSALARIKQIIGKNLDLIAMDACLMAMVEVAYQMKDSVNLFVASQQTIPGIGYPYSKFIRPLTTNPATTTALQLGQNIVSSYQQFYTNQQPTSDFTLSCIDVTSINLVKNNIDQFITAVNTCAKLDTAATKKLIITARKTASAFEMPEYIDLYSFYAGILQQRKTSRPKSEFILQHKKEEKKVTPTYQSALNTLFAVIEDGLTKITTVVLQSSSGPTYPGVKGLSIYYPTTGGIDKSYRLTLFAQNTAWINFIQTYKS